MRTDEYENGWSGQKQDFMNQIRCQLDPKVEGGCLKDQNGVKLGPPWKCMGLNRGCVLYQEEEMLIGWIGGATSIQAGSSVTQIRFIPFYDSQLRPIKLLEHVASFCKNCQ